MEGDSVLVKKKYPVMGKDMGEYVGQAAARPGDGGLPDGLVRSGVAAVPSQPPPKIGGVMWSYWKTYFLLLDRQLRNSSVTVKYQ